MRDDAGHAVGTRVAVGTGCLVLTGAGAAIRIAHEGILDIRAVDAPVGMPAAILGTETGGFIHVGGRQHEIDAIRIRRQGAGVDRGSDDGLPYVYIVTHYLSDNGLAALQPSSNGRKDDLAVARAKLDRSGAPLDFSNWNGASFAFDTDGRGGSASSMLSSASDGNFTACGDNISRQGRSQGSISRVEETRQYLLVFVCTSPGDPALGVPTAGETGSAWFYATADNLSDQSGWSIPKEIEGSYARHVESNQMNDSEQSSNDCSIFNGWYPNLMSLNKAPGHLSTRGYAFYMIGSLGACTDDDNDGDGGLAPRTYASRQFTIVTAPR